MTTKPLKVLHTMVVSEDGGRRLDERMRLVMCTGPKDSDVLVGDDGALLAPDRW